jgi:8-amino-7-oxononanoate synthase
MSLPPPLQQLDRVYVRHQGRRLLYFAGCDYFRLASHPKVLRALAAGARKFGLNVAASRATTGNHRLYEDLERRLARFFGVPGATLAANGYAPALMVAQALAGQFSHVLLDEKAHGCLVDAAQLFDCPVLRFKHRDADDVGGILRRLGAVQPVLLTDGMFAHDGGLAPLRDYLKRLPPRGRILLDDAHAAGVLGAHGRGTPEHAGVSRSRIIQTITLSKAFGVYGGAVLGARALRAAIVSRSRAFISSTPLPLPLANAALAAVSLLETGHRLRARLSRNVAGFKQRLHEAGFQPPKNPSPIFTVVPRDHRAVVLLHRRLLAAGIYPPFIKYPGGPEGGYFRFVISSGHTSRQIESLLAVLTSIHA